MKLFFILILAIPSLSEASHIKLSKEAIKLFDDNLVVSEEAACLKADPILPGYKDWLAGEVKRISDTEPLKGTTTTQVWDRDFHSLKIDGEVKDSQLDPKSPGTFGRINDKKINFSNVDDGKTLRAPIIDVVEGVSKDLKDRSDLENKIWLVEQSDLIPSVVALSMEAKLHKALGLIVFGEDKADLDQAGAVAALPVVRVSEELAKEIKKKIKVKETIGEISSRTEFPKNKSQEWVAVKKGTREIRLALTADYSSCKAVAILLGILDWQKKSTEEVQGTVFEFISQEKNPIEEVASEMKIDPASFNAQKFLTAWLKSDQDIADLIDGKKIIKRALNDAGQFTGLVDREILKQYKSELKNLETVVKTRPEIAFQLKNIYQSDALSDLALDLKNLRQVHNFAQRGLWSKAIDQFQKIPDYDWASNVSSPIFIQYTKSLGQPDFRVDPALWGQLQQGRDHLDGFIEAVEVEIDRLDKLLSDNFFKIHKSIENLDKI